jgi:hypothetical protein
LGLAAPTINRHITALRVIRCWAGSTALKDQRVESELRPDLMGHVGKTITEERYSAAASLKLLNEVVDRLPSATDHLFKR